MTSEMIELLTFDFSWSLQVRSKENKRTKKELRQMLLTQILKAPSKILRIKIVDLNASLPESEFKF